MIVKMKFEEGNIVEVETLGRLAAVIGEEPNTRKVKLDDNGRMSMAWYSDEEGGNFLDTHVYLDNSKEYVCDMDLMLEEFPNLQYTFKPIRRAAASMKHIESKFVDQVTSPITNNFNEHCEVHMPGAALSTYNEVLLLEDSCSDVLQENLTKGWRIIAACPQPNQRRPDYILGRFNPEIGINHVARRAK